MIHLKKSLQAWLTPNFNEAIKEEIEQLDASVLPLQQGLSHSSYAINGKFQTMVISASEHSDIIRVKTGIFFSGLIPGCSCADDPTPVSEYPEYCEVLFDINKETAKTSIKLLRN